MCMLCKCSCDCTCCMSLVNLSSISHLAGLIYTLRRKVSLLYFNLLLFLSTSALSHTDGNSTRTTPRLLLRVTGNFRARNFLISNSKPTLNISSTAVLIVFSSSKGNGDMRMDLSGENDALVCMCVCCVCMCVMSCCICCMTLFCASMRSVSISFLLDNWTRISCEDMLLRSTLFLFWGARVGGSS